MNIYLIGLPGSGKSTLAKQLASQLNYSFLDLDFLIEQKEQKSISLIFKENKESYFRKLETKYLKSTNTLSNTIIACGGGTPCFFDNIDWINKNGKSIYLNTSIETIISRIKNETTRPLLLSNKQGTLSTLLKQRKPFYEKAQLTCNACNLDNLIGLIKQE